jgi:hypothetical protein
MVEVLIRLVFFPMNDHPQRSCLINRLHQPSLQQCLPRNILLPGVSFDIHLRIDSLHHLVLLLRIVFQQHLILRYRHLIRYRIKSLELSLVLHPAYLSHPHLLMRCHRPYAIRCGKSGTPNAVSFRRIIIPTSSPLQRKGILKRHLVHHEN